MNTEELKVMEGEGADLLKEYIGDPEAELNSELQAYHYEMPSGLEVIKHPLVYSFAHHPMFNDRMNRMLAQKKTRIEEELAEQNWSTYIGLHERPWRINAFSDICDEMTDEDYWDHLGATWIDSDNIWENEEAWALLLSSDRPRRECMMDEDERTFLAKQPGILTVYRGFNLDGREDGMSYSLDHERAVFFAERYLAQGDRPRIVTAKVEQKDVLAYFNGRGEQEIVAFPESLTQRGIGPA